MEFIKPPYTVTEKTCTVVHSHEHGTDSWLASNRELGKQSVYIDMLEWVDDLDSDDIPHLLDLIEKDLFCDACNYWYDKLGESYELDGSTFCYMEDMSKEIVENIASVRKVREEENAEEETNEAG